ncbi:hypothetical protein NP233_g4845 [Leucocoprinus birnbaumii]|uniref:Transmembrane protein n=1 Tax=Leucocoprinus birnbaumii TaxID=56174 RepID=A0AAD5VWA0_9AGAR|nr:hypothetical protein NP233_g4845 [Leucocoprinus birnbaumii]
MQFLNATRESLSEGKSYALDASQNTLTTPFAGIITSLGGNQALQLTYLNETSLRSIFSCSGYDPSLDATSPARAMVVCAAFLGPPSRTDGGDIRFLNAGSPWSQRIHVCVSATQASIHKVTFSVNSTESLKDVHVSHVVSEDSVVWGVEKTNWAIFRATALWGLLEEEYVEESDALWTLQNKYLYLPAGEAEIFTGFHPGKPFSALNTIWRVIYDTDFPTDSLVNYSSSSDYAIGMKCRALVQNSSISGPAHIRNAIWTDLMANNIVGTASASTHLVNPYQPTLEYNFIFAIPGFFLFIIWVPTFIASFFLLVTRIIRFCCMKQVLNHTSIGHVVVGTSLLRVEGKEEEKVPPKTPVEERIDDDMNPDSSAPMGNEEAPDKARSCEDVEPWRSRYGDTAVFLALDHRTRRFTS